MIRDELDRACKLAELAGGGVGITLTAQELRRLLTGYSRLLDMLKDAADLADRCLWCNCSLIYRHDYEPQHSDSCEWQAAIREVEK